MVSTHIMDGDEVSVSQSNQSELERGPVLFSDSPLSSLLSSPLSSLSETQTSSLEQGTSISKSTNSEDSEDIPEFFNGKLRGLFKIDPNSTDESEWYGPWYYLLSHLFPVSEHFLVMPQRLVQSRRGGPDSALHYLVKALGTRIILVVNIKPSCHYNQSSLRHDAFDQLKNCLTNCLNPNLCQNVETVYGLSCFGHRFMVMQIDTSSKDINPKARARKSINDVCPAIWWRHKALKKQGCRRLLELAKHIKASLHKTAESRLSPTPIILSEDESDQVESDDIEEDQEEERKKRRRVD